MGQCVLVVDDDPTVSDVVRRYLERSGLAVTLAADGPAALRALEAERLVDGGLSVDVARRVATLHGHELALTVREFDLLVFLMRNPGRAYRRAELLEHVWGWTFGDQSTVTVHMRRLREKVEDDPAE